jgi:hypothetical protein
MTKIEICNMALAHIGHGNIIANINENSREAKACNRFYDIARLELIRNYFWKFSLRTQALSLVSENPTSEYGYAYRYPSDCLRALRILSGVRNDINQTRVVYRIFGNLIYTDRINAEMEYVADEQEAGNFPIDFAIALSYKLAIYILRLIASGDPARLKPQLEQDYMMSIRSAQANNWNEQQADPEPDVDLIQVRY